MVTRKGLMFMTQNEKRVYRRVPAYWAVMAIDKTNREYIGQCKNVSLGGVLIVLNKNFCVGTRFKLLIKAIIESETFELAFVVEVSYTALLASSSNYSIGLKIISDINNGKSVLKKYIQFKTNEKTDKK